MSVVSNSTYRVEPGGAADFRSALGTYKTYLEGFGVSVQLRQILYGGPRTGEVQLLLYSKDRAEHAANTDKIRADVANNPMAAWMASNRAATLLGRSLLVSIDDDAPIPTPAAVASTFGIQATPGKRTEALTALAAARSKHEGLGASIVTAIVEVAGPGSGNLVYGSRHESLVAAEAFRAQNVGAGSLPLREAAEQGVLTVVGRTIAIAYAV